MVLRGMRLKTGTKPWGKEEIIELGRLGPGHLVHTHHIISIITTIMPCSDTPEISHVITLLSHGLTTLTAKLLESLQDFLFLYSLFVVSLVHPLAKECEEEWSHYLCYAVGCHYS
jgi:hypothetical protein